MTLFFSLFSIHLVHDKMKVLASSEHIIVCDLFLSERSTVELRAVSDGSERRPDGSGRFRPDGSGGLRTAFSRTALRSFTYCKPTFRTVVQQLTRFQLTVRRGSSATAIDS